MTHRPSLNLCLKTGLLFLKVIISAMKNHPMTTIMTLFFCFFFCRRANILQPENKWPSNMSISFGSLFKCAFVFPTLPLFPPLSPPQDGGIVISAIIYLLMQTRPCPRCAGRQNIHIVVTGRPIKDEIGGM